MLQPVPRTGRSAFPLWAHVSDISLGLWWPRNLSSLKRQATTTYLLSTPQHPPVAASACYMRGRALMRAKDGKPHPRFAW